MVAKSSSEILILDSRGAILFIFVIVIFSLLPNGATLIAMYNRTETYDGLGFPFAWGYIVSECSLPFICGVGGKAIDLLDVIFNLFFWYIGTFLIVASYDEFRKVFRW